MKKYLSYLLLFLLPFVMASCGDDGKDNNDDEPSSGAVSTSIVGQWKRNFSAGYQLYTFERTGRYTLVNINIDYEWGNWSEIGTWSVKDGVLTLKYTDEYGECKEYYTILSLTNSKMMLREDEYWENGEMHDTSHQITEWTRVE